MSIGKFVLTVCLLTLGCSATQAFAQKEAAQPAEGSAPAPEKAAAEDSKTETPEKPRDRRSAKAAEKPAEKDAPCIRLLELSGQYVDLVQPLGLDPTSLLMGGESLKQKSFYKLCDYLHDLSKEEKVSHVVFDLSDAGLDMNPAQLDEVTRRIEKLKAAGKQTIVWLENPSNIQLALASACHQIVLGDFGGVDMPGMSMRSMFYRDAMDLVGVQASVVRAGDFKGAVEPYLNPQMSDHLRQHYLDMLTSINDAQVDRIAKGRGLTVATVREMQKKRLLLPEEALAKGLVDKLAPYGSMRPTIDEMIGKKLEWTKPKAAPRRDISFFELMGRVMAGDKKPTATVKEGTIAVLHLSGTIVDGKKESPGSIVAGPAVKSIEELTSNDKVKAVVVRINSPGGSATASEAIRRALASLADKKPTIISMGEMAASGGYWISCIGQPVYAEKGTITGSIGVFSLKLSMGSLFRRVGIHVESIALDDTAKSDSIDRAWSDQDVKLQQSFVDDVYKKFLQLVSKSRGLTVETLNDLAGGRVWSGTQAKSHKLVDEIGGLDDCLAAVAKKAKLEKYEVIHRPVVKSGFDLLELLGEEESNDVEVRQILTSVAFQSLARHGFDLSATRMLIEQAFAPQAGVPKVWALLPGEIIVK